MIHRNSIRSIQLCWLCCWRIESWPRFQSASDRARNWTKVCFYNFQALALSFSQNWLHKLQPVSHIHRKTRNLTEEGMCFRMVLNEHDSFQNSIKSPFKCTIAIAKCFRWGVVIKNVKSEVTVWLSICYHFVTLGKLLGFFLPQFPQ